jgi:predicted DNA-binding ribbon-helix-helix protein
MQSRRRGVDGPATACRLEELFYMCLAGIRSSREGQDVESAFSVLLESDNHI